MYCATHVLLISCALFCLHCSHTAMYVMLKKFEVAFFCYQRSTFKYFIFCFLYLCNVYILLIFIMMCITVRK